MSPSGSATTVATTTSLNRTSPAPVSSFVTFNATPLALPSNLAGSTHAPSPFSSSVTLHSDASTTSYCDCGVGSSVRDVPSGENPDPRTTRRLECAPYRRSSGCASTMGSQRTVATPTPEPSANVRFTESPHVMDATYKTPTGHVLSFSKASVISDDDALATRATPAAKGGANATSTLDASPLNPFAHNDVPVILRRLRAGVS
mmetsp:Transcript_112/g.323  ORF Transcript_112/g.323 Transcript_112/m.323 type:complete len:203 (+) Transcript_112:900-1508(+)